jgi:hypothetical protein
MDQVEAMLSTFTFHSLATVRMMTLMDIDYPAR